MVEICKNLPKQTCLLSSVLPKFKYIPNILENFTKHMIHRRFV